LRRTPPTPRRIGTGHSGSLVGSRASAFGMLGQVAIRLAPVCTRTSAHSVVRRIEHRVPRAHTRSSQSIRGYLPRDVVIRTTWQRSDMIAARVCSLHSTKNERSNLPGNTPGNNNG
jgi:hypothetical protein